MALHLPDGCLTQHQEQVAARVLSEESARRSHIVVSLSGAHAYGFPSPDSDLDLKAVHVLPTSRFVGLRSPDLHADRMEVLEGVEIDYTSNELGAVLQGVLKGNGNYIERFLGALQPVGSEVLDELRPLVGQALSRRVHAHYRGFATSQKHALDDPSKATAKKVLYVLRTTLTGAHVLLSGRVQTDLTALMDDSGFADARELIELKQRAERVALGPDRLEHWRRRLADAFAALDSARERSVLPEEPSNEREIETWLLSLRRRLWD
jgi:predicted nucleotidyltransferase